MEIRFSRFLLSVTAVGLMLAATVARSEMQSPDLVQEVESVIQPEVTRIEFEESKIDVGDFEVIPAIGFLSVEDFGANPVLNVKLEYHMSEDLFLGFELGRSKTGKSSYEILSGGAPLISDDDRVLTYYLFNIGYNLLPGEAYVTDKLTYNNALYVIGGMGGVDFAGDTRLLITLGVGYRLMLFDFSSVYLELRDHTFTSDVLGESKLTNNFEMTLGYSFYF
jgi:outer membrane beta-barrel protein